MARVFRVIGVIGELLITIGVVLLLYVGWQLFINDPLVGGQQQNTAEHYRSDNGQNTTADFKPIDDKLKQGQVFGRLYVPRFGKDYVRLIGQGTFQKITLNRIGPGHYLTSQWPGEIGNFAVAAHRTSHGAPFFKIDTLTTGDKVFVETNDNWYIYDYRQTKIVLPTDIGVIAAVPKEMDGAVRGGKYMTMTSCNPKWSSTQRIVVWLELEKVLPAISGKPQELIDLEQ